MMVEQPSEEDVAPLAVLEALFTALAVREIRSCHWKSNSHLAAAVNGETDLDLLVDRSRSGDFREVVADLGFKLLAAAPGKHYPGVENHLGYDVDSGRLVHLHVHYDLVLGQQHVKDYHLPIEAEMLASIGEIHGIPVPAPDVELIVLSLRAVLKYRLRDAVKDVLGARSPGIPPAIRREAEWLLSRTSIAQVRRTLEGLAPSVPSRLVLESIGRLTSPQVRGAQLLVLRERVRLALRPMQRVPRWLATGRYLAALGRKRAHAVGMGQKRRMTRHDGGMTIAFVGSDGAGKSTVVAALREWLSWRLDVATFYMGIPDAKGSAWVLKRASKAAASAHRRVRGVRGEADGVARALQATSHLLLGLRRVGEARSRLRRSQAAHRRAEEGAIVLFDRYPLPSVPVYGRAMDGARLEQEIASSPGGIMARLVNRERRLYERIPEPNRIVALNVSAAESLRRKPDHDPEGIAAKTEAIRSSVAAGAQIVVVNADQSADRVLDEVRAKIWSWL